MLNVVTLIGRLVRDPETRTCDDGKIICKFSVAVSRNKDKTDFISCIAWDNLGQYIERHFHKGDFIGVAGSLQIEAYTTKHGDRANKATVVVDSVSAVLHIRRVSVQRILPNGKKAAACLMFSMTKRSCRSDE